MFPNYYYQKLISKNWTNRWEVVMYYILQGFSLVVSKKKTYSFTKNQFMEIWIFSIVWNHLMR